MTKRPTVNIGGCLYDLSPQAHAIVAWIVGNQAELPAYGSLRFNFGGGPVKVETVRTYPPVQVA